MDSPAMRNGISADIEMFNSCSCCKACGAWKDERQAVQRLNVVLTRGNDLFETEVCTAAGNPAPSERTLVAHLAFLASLLTDPDDMRSDQGYVRPTVAYALADQRKALRKFFTPQEVEQLRAGVQLVTLDSLGEAA
jgi:hypothetical protein